MAKYHQTIVQLLWEAKLDEAESVLLKTFTNEKAPNVWIHMLYTEVHTLFYFILFYFYFFFLLRFLFSIIFSTTHFSFHLIPY